MSPLVRAGNQALAHMWWSPPAALKIALDVVFASEYKTRGADGEPHRKRYGLIAMLIPVARSQALMAHCPLSQ